MPACTCRRHVEKHEWLYRKGRLPLCLNCGLEDHVWACALKHGEHCEREKCKPRPCKRAKAPFEKAS